MRTKPGVGIRKLAPQIVFAQGVVERVCLNHFGLGYEPTLTSINDSHQSGLHPKGFAFDVRTKDMLREDAAIIFVEVHKRLEALGFDVLWEDRDGPNQHFHIEYDPKAGEA
jgi:hypothetical protein